MPHLLMILVAAGSLEANPIPKAPDAVPSPPPMVSPFLRPTPPTPQAIADVEARRKELNQLPFGSVDPKQAAVVLAWLDGALKSGDDHVVFEAARDVSNNNYHALPEADFLKILVPHLRKPPSVVLDQRGMAQSYILEHVSRRFGPKAKEILPDLLKTVRNDKVAIYHRSMAVQAAARIGPGDKDVVAAFIDALNNPNPKDTSGVHDYLIERLGNMGKAAWPAKQAIAGVLTSRTDWYHDAAFIALGKLAQDDTPRPLADYLERLQQIDKLPMEEVAAAFLHVQKLCNPGAEIRDPNSVPTATLKGTNPKLAEQARPVLFRLVDQRFKDDVSTRAALRTLSTIGAGSNPGAAKVLLRYVTFEPTKYHRFQEDAGYALSSFEAKDPDAVPILADGLDKLLTTSAWTRRQIVLQVLERYGKDARPALPVILKAMERMEKTAFAPEELYACAETLNAMGGDLAAGCTLLIRFLDKDGALMKQVHDGPSAKTGDRERQEIRDHLLLALSKMAFPAGTERTELLAHVRAGLKSDHVQHFTAAALVVQRTGNHFTQSEADELVPILVRVLSGKHVFAGEGDNRSPWQRRPNESPILQGAPAAVLALGALGPKARKALPVLDALAAQPLVDVRGTYRSEPPTNFTIREARKAVKQVRD